VFISETSKFFSIWSFCDLWFE